MTKKAQFNRDFIKSNVFRQTYIYSNGIVEGVPIDFVGNTVDILPYFKAFLVGPPPVDVPAWIYL